MIIILYILKIYKSRNFLIYLAERKVLNSYSNDGHQPEDRTNCHYHAFRENRGKVIRSTQNGLDENVPSITYNNPTGYTIHTSVAVVLYVFTFSLGVIVSSPLGCIYNIKILYIPLFRQIQQHVFPTVSRLYL
jgi:hypothetical protein